MPETIKFIHQCLYSPTVDTLCKAIDNNQLIGFPNLTSKLVQKYLPDSTATAKGHMNRTKRGLRSTTKSQTSKAEEIEKDYHPNPNEDAEVEIFVGANIGEKNDGVIYTDHTGNMPMQSYHGKKCHFVAYEYQSNAILVRALRDQSENSLQEAFEDVYSYIASKGFKPKFNIMYNQCSRRIQKYITSQGTNIQLVNPDDYRVNAAERAIQTWKNHYVAGLSTTDPNCPLQL